MGQKAISEPNQHSSVQNWPARVDVSNVHAGATWPSGVRRGPSISTQRLRRLAGSLGVVALSIAVLSAKSSVGGVVAAIGAMPVRAGILLASLLLVHRGMNALLQRGAFPSVSLPKVMLATEAHTGMSNSMVGGASVGTGLRVAMLRSWGVDGLSVSLGILATSLVPVLAMWTIAVAHTVPLLLSGRADRLESLIAFAGIGVFAGAAVVIRHVTRSETALARAVVVFGRVRRAAVRRFPRVGQALVDRLPDDQRIAVDVRSNAVTLLRERWIVLAVSAIAAQVVLALVLVGCAAAVAPHTAVPVLSLLRAFALLRVASSFVPVPGGIGIVDVGLAGALRRGGLSGEQAVAALALFRTLTFVLPVVTGPICAALWWRQNGRARRG